MLVRHPWLGNIVRPSKPILGTTHEQLGLAIAYENSHYSINCVYKGHFINFTSSANPACCLEVGIIIPVVMQTE